MDKILIILALLVGSNGSMLQCKVDLAFAVDSSSSIWEEDFKLQKQFLAELVKRLPIGPDNVRVSALSFSNIIREEFQFSQTSNLESVLRSIDAIPYTAGDATRTYEAIRRMRQSLFLPRNGARSNVLRLGIVLTDGVTNPGRYDGYPRSVALRRTQSEARAARNDNIVLIAVGIGKNTNETELKGIASDPDDQHYIHVGKFEKLISEQIINLLSFRACKNDIPTTTPEPVTTTERASGEDPGKECQNKAADVMFLLDQSTTIGSEENFQKELDFVNNVIDYFDVSPTMAQISVIKFSTESEIAFPLNRYTDKNTLREAVSRLEWGTGDTYTDKALDQMMREGFSKRNGERKSIPKIAIVITDGNSTDPTSTRAMAQKAKNKGITIFAIGIGSVNRQELIDIASAPSSSYVKSVNNLDMLESLKRMLAFDICKKPQPPGPKNCSNGKADIVFVSDASTSIGQSDFDKELTFIQKMIQRFPVSEDGVRVGMITYSTEAELQFHLNDYKTSSAVSSAVRHVPWTTGLTYTDKGLDYMISEFLNYGRGPEVPKIGILITDGTSRNVPRVLEAVRRIESMKIKLFAIGVGPYVAPEFLRQVASRPTEVFYHKVEDFSSFNNIDNLIVRGACDLLFSPEAEFIRELQEEIQLL